MYLLHLTLSVLSSLFWLLWLVYCLFGCLYHLYYWFFLCWNCCSKTNIFYTITVNILMEYVVIENIPLKFIWTIFLVIEKTANLPPEHFYILMNKVWLGERRVSHHTFYTTECNWFVFIFELDMGIRVSGYRVSVFSKCRAQISTIISWELV